jgi:hypothetical protein
MMAAIVPSLAAFAIACGGGGSGGDTQTTELNPDDLAADTDDFAASTTDVTEEVISGMLGNTGTAFAVSGQANSSGGVVTKVGYQPLNGNKIPTFKSLLNGKKLFVNPELNEIASRLAYATGHVRTDNYNNLIESGVALKSLVNYLTTEEDCLGGGTQTAEQPDNEVNGNYSIVFDNCDDGSGVVQNGMVEFTVSSNVSGNASEAPTDVEASITMTFTDLSTDDDTSDETCNNVNGQIAFAVSNTIDEEANSFSDALGLSFTDFTADCDDDDDVLINANFSLTAEGDTVEQNLGDTDGDGVEETFETTDCNENLVVRWVFEALAGTDLPNQPTLGSDLVMGGKITFDANCSEGTVVFAFGDGEEYIVLVPGDNNDMNVCGTDGDASDDDALVDIQEDGGTCTAVATGAVEDSIAFDECGDFDISGGWDPEEA